MTVIFDAVLDKKSTGAVVRGCQSEALAASFHYAVLDKKSTDIQKGAGLDSIFISANHFLSNIYLFNNKSVAGKWVRMTVFNSMVKRKWPIFATLFGISALATVAALWSPSKPTTTAGFESKRGPASSSGEVPTGLDRSPLFGAKPFTQSLMVLEEFGTEPVPTASCSSCVPLPMPRHCDEFPDSSELDHFLNQTLHPLPTREANTSLPNSWAERHSQCLHRFVRGNIEGRPPGPNFSHQRYAEFAPELYFQSVQTGARVNGGVRDRVQRHRYAIGEFGPGGLYHEATGPNGFNGSTKGVEVRLHPQMPVQKPESLWTFDGTFPPKLLMAPYGSSVVFRHYNALPIDVRANAGFGKNTITTHEHNGHNPGESDGLASAFFFPGAFYDYNWPMILAGHDSINTSAADPRAGSPDGRGGIKKIRGDWRETMSTHWFHDHMLDFTAPNVYKGNAAMMNYYSSVDRGREPASLAEARGATTTPGYGCHYSNAAHPNLCIASGSGLDWGNRDYDVNLMIADKAVDSSGQLVYNPFNTDGFLGDLMTVNWLYKPYLEVRARRYRFRILNAAVARYFKIALIDQKGKRVPFHMIANDGNLMEHAIPFPNAQSLDLPEQGVAERYDIVIDFSRFKDGDKLYFVNLLEHRDGRRPKEAIDLAEILSGKYDRDPAVGKFLEFRVKSHSRADLSMNPLDYEPGKKKMIPLPGFTADELAKAKHRTFEFGRSNGTDSSPWTIRTDGGEGLTAHISRLHSAPDMDTVEIWHLVNESGGWSHPVHIHFEEGQILKRDGKAPPLWEKGARKDVFRIGPFAESGRSVDIAIRFREFMGTYMEHCHNTTHEDHAMLLRWDVEKPGQLVPFMAPIATIDGVIYEDTVSLPTYKSGDSKGSFK